VHIIKDEADWLQAQKELQPAQLKSIFPENVLNTNHFIIEEFIEGEEYAIDYYHNEQGEVVILNILHHVFSSGTDTSDRVYSTSKAIIETHQTSIQQLLQQIGQELNLKNFPAHAEVRIDKNGKIVPIEINPLRSGGFCTTGDLLGLTLGFNAHQSFYENKKPNWEHIFKGKEEQIFSIVILNNNSGIASTAIASFNYSALAKDFENAVVIRALDIRQYPVFGFVFTETSPQNSAELQQILTSDLKKYITKKK
ncbi:MAG: ATP-grasp domain-containing protein, partial [Saprospiraceae bacterium]